MVVWAVHRFDKADWLVYTGRSGIKYGAWVQIPIHLDTACFTTTMNIWRKKDDYQSTR